MSTTLSRVLALFVASLLAVGLLAATPLSASAAERTIPLTVEDGNGVPLTSVTVVAKVAQTWGGETEAPIVLTEDPETPGLFAVPAYEAAYTYVTLTKPGYETTQSYVLGTYNSASFRMRQINISGTVTGQYGVLSYGNADLYDAVSRSIIDSTAVSDGTYQFIGIQPGSYFVRFSATGYESVISDGQVDDVSVADGFTLDDTITVDATMQPVEYYSITGTLTLPGSSTDPVDAKVSFQRLVGSTWSDEGSTSSDDAGIFQSTLPSGYYRVLLAKTGFKVISRYVSIASGDGVVNAQLSAVATADIVGSVVAPLTETTGVPITVSAYQQIAAGQWRAVASTQASSDGSYRLTVASGLAYRVLFSDASSMYLPRAYPATDSPADVASLPSSSDISVDPSGATLDTTTLTQGTQLSSGTFVYYGKPVANATVTISAYDWSTNDFEVYAHSTTNADGVFTAYLPEASYYSLSATADGYQDVDLGRSFSYYSTGASTPVDFGTQQFTHATSSTVSGTTVDQYGDPTAASVTLLRTDDGGATFTAVSSDDLNGQDNPLTDTDGTYSWTVDPGTYQVSTGGVTSDQFAVEPSTVVPALSLTVDGAAPPISDDIADLAPAKIDATETAPDVAWKTGWSTTSISWFVDGNLVSSDASFTPGSSLEGSALTVEIAGSDGSRTYSYTTPAVTIRKNTLTDGEVSLDGLSFGTYVGSYITASTVWDSTDVDETWTWTNDAGDTLGTGNYYVLTAADFGSEITATVVGTKDGYTSFTRKSGAFHLVGTLAVPPIDVTGDLTIGSTATASMAGLPAGVTPTFVWHTYDSDETETGPTHVITATDFLRGAYVTADAPQSSYTSFDTSASVDLVSLTLPDATASVTGATGPSGAATVGDTLTAAVTGAPSDATITGSWAAPASRAFGSSDTYAVADSDSGQTLRYTATISKPGYTDETVSAVVHVTGRVITPATVTITPAGANGVGTELDAAYGSFGGPDPESIYLTGEWFRDGIDTGVQGDAYTIQPGDQGSTLTYRLTAGAYGYDDVTAEASVSVPLEVIVAGTPTMTGTGAVGSTLTATTGTWATGVKTDGQWLRNGVEIAGETGLTHAVTAADQGANVSFRVTASKPYSASKVVTVTTAIAAAHVDAADPLVVVVEKIVTVTNTVTIYSFGSTPAPTVTGKAKVGSTLKAKAGAWKPTGATLTYQWYAGGKAISGATKSSLKLAKSVKGKKITVAVTATKAGYLTASVASKASVKVAK